MKRRTALSSAALSAVVIAAAAPAWSFWTTTSTGATGSSRAGSISAPDATAKRFLPILGGFYRFKVTPPSSGIVPGYDVHLGSTLVCTIDPGENRCDSHGLVVALPASFTIKAKLGNWTSTDTTRCDFPLLSINVTCVPSTAPLPFAAAAPAPEPADAGEGAAPAASLAPGVPSAPSLHADDDTGVSDSDGVTREAEPRLVGKADPGSTVVLTEGATELGRGTADADGKYSVKAVLTEGTHAIVASATNGSATSALSGEGAVDVDLTAPQISGKVLETDGAKRTVGGKAGVEHGDLRSVHMSGENGGPEVTTDIAVGDDGQYGTDIAVEDGTTTVTLTQLDVAGNKGVEKFEIVVGDSEPDEPESDKPKDEPKAEEPKADKPKADKPKHEPKADEPKADKPKDEKPKDEVKDEPKAEDPEPAEDDSPSDSGKSSDSGAAPAKDPAEPA